MRIVKAYACDLTEAAVNKSAPLHLAPQVLANKFDGLELIATHPTPLTGAFHQSVANLIPHALDSRLHLLRLVRLHQHSKRENQVRDHRKG